MGLITFIVVYTIVSAGLLLRSQASARRFSALSWDELRSQLAPVSRDDLDIVRLHDKKCEVPQSKECFAAIARRLGRKQNIRRIEKNALVLIALAAYCDNWCQHSSAATVIELRGHAKILRRAIWRYRICVLFGVEKARAQRDIVVISCEYIEMIDHVLLLYNATHVGRYRQVRVACN